MDVLVLNVDAQPISYLPLSTVTWESSITYLWLGKCTAVDWYDEWTIRSPSCEYAVPSVIMLKKFHRKKPKVKFTRDNIFLRDMYTCQYCGYEYSEHELTIDHVIPSSLGGANSWENVVTACARCNTLKGDKTTIKPLDTPKKPSYYSLVNNKKIMGISVRHDSWLNYIDAPKPKISSV